MIAADDDRRRQLTAGDEVIEGDAELCALAETEPTDPGGQSLELHFLAGDRDPTSEMLVIREELEHQIIGAVDILWIAGQRHPTERSLALAEQRSDVLGNKAGDRERVANAGVERHRSNVVPIVECHGAA